MWLSISQGSVHGWLWGRSVVAEDHEGGKLLTPQQTGSRLRGKSQRERSRGPDRVVKVMPHELLRYTQKCALLIS